MEQHILRWLYPSWNRHGILTTCRTFKHILGLRSCLCASVGRDWMLFACIGEAKLVVVHVHEPGNAGCCPCLSAGRRWSLPMCISRATPVVAHAADLHKTDRVLPWARLLVLPLDGQPTGFLRCYIGPARSFGTVCDHAQHAHAMSCVPVLCGINRAQYGVLVSSVIMLSMRTTCCVCRS